MNESKAANFQIGCESSSDSNNKNSFVGSSKFLKSFNSKIIKRNELMNFESLF